MFSHTEEKGAEEKECLKNEMEFFMKNKTIGLYVASNSHFWS